MNTTINGKLDLASPWVIYWKQLCELFKGDDDIRISFNNEERRITLRVDNTDKYNALNQLLPSEKEFGNVKLQIAVVPANLSQKSRVDLIKDLFKNNHDISRMVTIDDVLGNPVTYVAFKPDIVQYKADNLHDINGNVTTLRETVAKDIIGEEEGVCFCTDDADFSYYSSRA